MICYSDSIAGQMTAVKSLFDKNPSNDETPISKNLGK